MVEIKDANIGTWDVATIKTVRWLSVDIIPNISVYSLSLSYDIDHIQVTKSTGLHEAVHCLLANGLSIIPVVDEQTGKVVEVFTKTNIIRLFARSKSPDPTDAYRDLLNLSVGDKLKNRLPNNSELWNGEFTVAPPPPGAPPTCCSPMQSTAHPDCFCSPSDTVLSVVQRFIKSRQKCIYVISDERRLLGKVKLTDLMTYLIATR